MKEAASVGGLFHFLGFSRRGKSAKGSVKLPALVGMARLFFAVIVVATAALIGMFPFLAFAL
jgi:hypothetical protein